ncbi:hypothetical protein E2986_05581 [Frieseomelitta varia]|uniref:Uncharacterized protein n=1 Tax=Frieseomelitta varia TaxID=561572 RepID=A0A833VVV9_9HYME|nr:hypothetical protein E2986_05581 [Frieseomelitta varia]
MYLSFRIRYCGFNYVFSRAYLSAPRIVAVTFFSVRLLPDHDLVCTGWGTKLSFGSSFILKYQSLYRSFIG